MLITQLANKSCVYSTPVDSCIAEKENWLAGVVGAFSSEYVDRHLALAMEGRQAVATKAVIARVVECADLPSCKMAPMSLKAGLISAR